MKRKIKNFYFLMTLENVAIQMFSSLTYLLLIYLDYNLIEIGYFLAVFTAVTMITEIPSGILVDSIGTKKVLILSFTIRAIGLFIMAYSHNFSILILTGILTGVASSLSSGTLESWIVNEINKSGKDYEIGQLFSKLNIISPFFGLISGFLGAQIFGKNNPTIPFYIAVVLYIFLIAYVFFVRDIFEGDFKPISLGKIREVYKETIVNLVNAFKNLRILLYFLMFIMTGLLDLGPSNQWQVVLSESVEVYIVGYYIIGIGLATILSNIFLSRYLLEKKLNFIAMIDSVLTMDAILLLVISFVNELFPYIFLLHVFLVGINGTLIITYIHDKLTTSDKLRTSIISSFYSLQALLSSLLLVFNGYLSQNIGISNTWIVFSILSFVLYSVMRVLINIYNKKKAFND